MKDKLKKIRAKLFDRPIVDKVVRKMTGRSLGNSSLIHSKTQHSTLYLSFCGLLAADQQKINFIQVGANDGFNDDPINHLVHQYGKQVLLVEPQPSLISELENNYKKFQGKLLIENCAVGPKSGYLNLYHLKEEFRDLYFEKVGRRADQLVSFDKTQISQRLLMRPYNTFI